MDDGIAQIGYIYTFIISSILLTSVTLVTSDMVKQSGSSSLYHSLHQMAKNIATKIEDVISASAKYPDMEYRRTVELQVTGYLYRYRLAATSEYIYLNSTYRNIRIKVSIMNPGNIPVLGSVSSSAGEMEIVYHLLNSEPRIDLLPA